MSYEFPVTIDMFQRNYVKENCPKIDVVGVWGHQNHIPPTGFVSDYQLDDTVNKSSYSEMNSVTQEPQVSNRLNVTDHIDRSLKVIA
jgi:hypothetical protein